MFQWHIIASNLVKLLNGALPAICNQGFRKLWAKKAGQQTATVPHLKAVHASRG